MLPLFWGTWLFVKRFDPVKGAVSYERAAKFEFWELLGGPAGVFVFIFKN